MVEFDAARPAGIKRVVFKEILEGDLRKFQADSNDADTGGGARDLRFRPFKAFDEIFAKLFPETRLERRRRGAADVEVAVRVGRFAWQAGATTQYKAATFEPPTDARPDEGRIPVVHTYPPLVAPPASGGGRLVLMFVQREDDSVWPHFATETSLGSGAWHPAVSKQILECLNAPRPKTRAARGFIDFEEKRRFCGG